MRTREMQTMVLVAAALGILAGVSMSATLYDALFAPETGFTAEFENGEVGGDQMPTMEVEVGPALGGAHTCDFKVQGHSGTADITTAFVEVTDAGMQTTVYTATYANGGLVTTAEGTLATLSGIQVPTDFHTVRLAYVYSDGECYDFEVGADSGE